MKMKSLLMATLAAVGMVGFTSAHASFNITNKSAYPTISVTCNGKPGVPIIKGNPLKLPYSTIVAMFGTNKLNCNFFVGATQLGGASLEIAAGNATAVVTSASAIIPYKVVPGVNVSAANIDVNLCEQTALCG